MNIPKSTPGILPQGALGGLLAPWVAIAFLIKHPRLWFLAIAPFILNLVLFGLGFWLGMEYLQKWIQAFTHASEGIWWQILYYLVMVFAVIALLGLFVLFFATIGRILAAPFLEPLTQKTETIALNRPTASAEFGFWQSILRVAIQEGKKLLLYCLLMAVLLIVNLVPVIGTAVYAFLSFLATSFFLCLEFLDFPLERRGLSLKAKIFYSWNLGFTGLLFGASLTITFLVPIVNLALLPAAAVGGTLFFLEHPLDPELKNTMRRQ